MASGLIGYRILTPYLKPDPMEKPEGEPSSHCPSLRLLVATRAPHHWK